MGTAIHETVARTVQKLNKPGWLVEQKVTLAGISGTFDLYVPSTVIDWKTTNTNGAKTIGVHGPYLSQLWQVHLYGAAAVATLGVQVERVRLNYIVRDSGAEVIYDAALDLNLVRDALKWAHDIKIMDLDDLPRDYAPDSVFCRGCPYGGDDGGICWDGGVPDRDPRSVEYHGNLEELVEELYNVRQTIKTLREREANLKGTLSAVEPDDDTVIVAGSRAIQWKGSNRALTFVPPPQGPSS